MPDIVKPFCSQTLKAIAKVLAHTDDGLTGSEIGFILQDSKIPDVDSQNTKWKRLYNAFVEIQNKKGYGNHIIMFINRVMNPSSYTDNPIKFQEYCNQLNPILSLVGMEVAESGKVRKVTATRTLEDARSRASQIHKALVDRNVHCEVLRFCRAEFFQENYFHAVFEAMKSVSSRVREVSNLEGDGAELFQRAFAMGRNQQPVVAINSLISPSQISEQKGFLNLLIGLFGLFRNPLAHDPKIEWNMGKQDALDILTTLSMVHRKLENAVKTCN